jgi:deoxyribodipyrimidine photo-lyase
MLKKECINVVWFKRDLRLSDHRPLYEALAGNSKVLLLFVEEEMLTSSIQYSERHWNFIKQSLLDMNSELEVLDASVFSCRAECINLFKRLTEQYEVQGVYSYVESDIPVTYKRNNKVSRFFKNNGISWYQFPRNGVVSDAGVTEQWRKNWVNFMSSPIETAKLVSEKFLTREDLLALHTFISPLDLNFVLDNSFQIGGRKNAVELLNGFLNDSINDENSLKYGYSRLSPYLSWGNLSLREVYKFVQKFKFEKTEVFKRNSFLERLYSQSEYIQNFEREHSSEQSDLIWAKQKLKPGVSKKYQDAWKSATTGIPIIDACMICLEKTGYLSYDMRTLLVCFFTQDLLQPWQDAAAFLSSLFLDFHPGVHYPQLEALQGKISKDITFGNHPISFSKNTDPDGLFIKKWIPQLANLPIKYIHEPYLMSPLEQQIYNIVLGKDYPKPIVDLIPPKGYNSNTGSDNTKSIA